MTVLAPLLCRGNTVNNLQNFRVIITDCRHVGAAKVVRKINTHHKKHRDNRGVFICDGASNSSWQHFAVCVQIYAAQHTGHIYVAFHHGFVRF